MSQFARVGIVICVLTSVVRGSESREVIGEVLGKPMLEQMQQHADREFATFILSHWKSQRLLYDRYGGGRLNYQQLGPEAFDAMLKWLQEAEIKGDVKFLDLEVREMFFEYWTREKHLFVSDEELDEVFVKPAWGDLGWLLIRQQWVVS